MMLVSDGGTSMKFPLFLNNKTKEASLAAFRDWVTAAELQTGKRLKCVRFDLGGEFDNTLFCGWCRERGIAVEKLPKDSSSANGHVERGNRTVIEGTRTQLIESGLDKRFWAEAAAAHCYVRGFIPSSRHPDVIPWVAWHRKTDADGNLLKPKISHLRAWGSECWVKDLDNREGKLGDQGWKGRMVGYMGRRGYRIYDPSRVRIFQVRNVIFEEGNPHRTRAVEPEEDLLPQDASIFDGPDLPPHGADNDAPAGTENGVPPPPPGPPPGPPPPPTLPRRSARAPKPTRAILEAEQTLLREEEARLARKDWARDNRRPTGNAVDVDWEGFDNNLLQSPWAFASAIKGSIPRNYYEAMREPEKWVPPMQAEFDQLKTRGVWKRVDLPAGERAIDGMWVYDLKVDGDGNVLKRKARYVARGDEMVEGKDFE
jgi:hypothetical protein